MDMLPKLQHCGEAILKPEVKPWVSHPTELPRQSAARRKSPCRLRDVPLIAWACLWLVCRWLLGQFRQEPPLGKILYLLLVSAVLGMVIL